MELDHLKARWLQETKLNLEKNQQTMEQLQLLLKEKSAQTLSGMKKKYEKIISYLFIGIMLNIIIHPFLHFLLGDDVPVFQITYSGLLSMSVLIIIGLIVLFYYWKKYTAVPSVLSEDIQPSLKHHISRLKKALKQEIVFIASIFTSLFVVGRISSEHLGNGDFGDIFHKDIMLSMLAAFLMMGFYIYKRVAFYKRNIHELEGYLAELESE